MAPKQSRTFTTVKVGDTRGNAKGRSNKMKRMKQNPGSKGAPMAAAMKAFTFACNQSTIKGFCTLVISIRETTRGSSDKILRYKVTRRLVNKRVTRKDGSTTLYKYSTSAKSLN